MNNISLENFKNTPMYQNFISENPGSGNLMIRSNAAGGAIPISGLNVVVSNIIDNMRVIFFSGVTDESGMINRISLPAPTQTPSDLDIPKYLTYDITATYPKNNTVLTYRVNIYDNVCVVQNINIVPEVGLNRGIIYGN